MTAYSTPPRPETSPPCRHCDTSYACLDCINRAGGSHCAGRCSTTDTENLDPTTEGAR